MTKYGRSPWVDRFPKSRIPSHPRHRGHLETDIIIVGGGMTGCATAYAFAAAGIKVALLEADRIGRAVTNELALAASAHGGLRHTGGATLDPYRACLGLAAAATKRGAQLFERSPVKKIKFGRRAVVVQTSGGTLRADQAIVATG